jgi:hypothetical protein
VVTLFVLAAGILAVESFWNPWLVAGPVLLTLVLAAAAADGSWLSFIALLLAGSYAVQTDVGTAPVVGLAAVVGVAGLVVALVRDRRRPDRPRRRADGRWRRTPVVLGTLGVAGLVLLWLPPLLQQIAGTGQPHNLSALVDFFLHPPPARTIPGGIHHSWSVAVAQVSTATTAVPFGGDPTSRTVPPSNAAHVVVFVAWMVVALAAAVVAVRRRRRFELALAALSLAAVPVALFATTRIAGPVYPYLLSWAAFLPVPGLIAAGSLAIRWAAPRVGAWRHVAPRLRVVRGVVAAILLVPVAVLAWQLALRPPSAHDNGDPAVTRLAAFARSHLPAHAGRPLVDITSLDRWPVTTGLVWQLERDGVDAVVTPQWGFMFTGRDVVSGTPRWEIVVSPAPTPGSPPPTATGPRGATTTVGDGQFGPTTIEVRPQH